MVKREEDRRGGEREKKKYKAETMRDKEKETVKEMDIV